MNKTQKTNAPDLSGFNYNSLQGDDFMAYQKIANSLPADQENEYDQYRATGIFRFRLNELTGDKEEYLYGLTINSNGKLNTTKIANKYARELNNQIYAKHPASNSRYFLLKKEEA